MEKVAEGFKLLEGPVWDPARGLLVADAEKGGVYCIGDDGHVSTVVEHRRGIGGMVLHEDGGLVVSGRNIAYKGAGAEPTKVVFDNDPESGRVGFNDITTDAEGRIYAGSLGYRPTVEGDVPRPGALHMIELDGSVRLLFAGVKLANGMAFSPDGRLFYHADSGDQTVYVFDVEPGGGLANRRPFAGVELGVPDGLAVSEDGAVWVAVAYAGEVRVYEPHGALRRRLEFPIPMVTSLCFGGSDLRSLYVVTGSEGAEGDAGTVFRLASEVPGRWASPARVHIG
jgi:gluconolactonase